MSQFAKLSIGLVALFSLLIPIPGSPGGESPTPAPDFTLDGLSGGEVTLADFKGKVLFINFWATWCPPCRQEIPGFLEVYEKYKDDGMEILGISLDRKGAKVVREFAEKLNIAYPLAMANQAVVEAYRPGQYIPATIVIDRSGNIRDKHVGFLNKQALEEMYLEYSK